MFTFYFFQISKTSAFLYLTVISLTSTLVGVYGLTVLYKVSSTPLKKYWIREKFLALKTVMIVPNLQTLLLAVLIRARVIRCLATISAPLISNSKCKMTLGDCGIPYDRHSCTGYGMFSLLFNEPRIIVNRNENVVSRMKIGRMRTPAREAFSYGILHVFIVIQWIVTYIVQWITKKTCRIQYENASRTGVRILPNVCRTMIHVTSFEVNLDLPWIEGGGGSRMCCSFFKTNP